MPLNYKKFIQGTKRVSPTSLDRERLSVHVNIESSYDADTQTVTFMTHMNSFSHNGIRHDVMISFEGVPPDQLYQDPEEVQENLERNNGNLIPIPIVYKNPMRVRCSCPSFRFTGSEAAINYSSFIGRNYTPWIPKRSNRAPRNPRNLPMLCKHLLSFMDALYAGKYIVSHHL